MWYWEPRSSLKLHFNVNLFYLMKVSTKRSQMLTRTSGNSCWKWRNKSKPKMSKWSKAEVHAFRQGWAWTEFRNSGLTRPFLEFIFQILTLNFSQIKPAPRGGFGLESQIPFRKSHLQKSLNFMVFWGNRPIYWFFYRKRTNCYILFDCKIKIKLKEKSGETILPIPALKPL